MSRTTIDYGIDLGTTNSAIAVLNGVEPEIIKNTDDQDATPSAVFINKQNVVRVGTRAKNATNKERTSKDAHSEFKRQMGTPHEYEFPSSGQKKKAEELSAEILKDLKASVGAKSDEIIQSAVVTVPAAFELHQCDATRQAAELAGLMGSPLLQEPVAAALSYGFQVDSEKAYWMVYDFGGGTFDAALIKADEGMINVVHHGGDNFLGGSDIDWAIIETVLVPQLTKNFDLPGFSRGSDRWSLTFKQIKHAVEQAKIELSTKETTTLSDELVFEDDSGEEVVFSDISLSRNDLIKVAEPIITRSIDITKGVLAEKNLGLEAVDKAIIVGGPTKAPYFRELLSAGLGVPIDFSQDPLTVVARGAAVFASTQSIDAKLQKKAKVGEFQVQVSDKYNPVGHESDPLIAGKVTSPDGNSVEGFSIEFVNRDSKWRSGKVPLNAKGAFMANLLAEKGSRNTFHIEVSNSRGDMQKAVPDHVVYTIGAVIEEQPLLKSIGLAKADNSVDWFFESGSGLPQKKRWDRPYQTTVAIKAGEAGKALRIPVVEGENDYADRNRVVGFLEIDSSMITRDLSAGAEVELALRIDESRVITMEAFFPQLDEDFVKKLDLEKAAADPEAINNTLKKEKERLNELKEKAEGAKDDGLLDELEHLESDKDREEAVRAAKGDPGAAEKAQKRVEDLQNQLDSVERKLRWPAQVAEVRELQSNLQALTADHGTSDHGEKVSEWSEETDAVIDKKQEDRLERKLEEGHAIRAQVLFSIPAFWVTTFQQMESNRGSFTDAAAAERLFERGREYLQNNNVDGLKDVVGKLWSNMPEGEAELSQRGVGATIL